MSPFLSSLAAPSVLVVSTQGGAGVYTSLEDALDDAETGDRIEIHDGGTFVVADTLDEAITIVGVGVRPVLRNDDPGNDDGVFRIDADGEDVVFDNLAFDGQGGSRAMRVHRGRVRILDCTFDDHAETGSGGAIVSDSNSSTRIEIRGSVFTGATSGSDGGFVSMPDGTLLILDSRFASGAGRFGGAIDVGGATLEVSGSTFVDNASTADGGAIHAGGTTTIADSTFVGNTADTGGKGGAVAQQGGVASFARVVACDNRASTTGGALYLLDTVVDLTNSVFVRNRADDGGDGGGALRVSGGSAFVTHVSAVANTGAPGEAISGDGSIAVSDSYFGHHGPGSAVASSNQDSVAVSFCGFSDNAIDFDEVTDDGGDHRFGGAGIPLPPAGSCAPLDLVPPAGSDLIGHASDGSDIGAFGGIETWPDDDGDGATTISDCDDADPSVFPGADELPGDEVDQDCDGTELCYGDPDGDGEGEATEVESADTDCDDAGELGAITDRCPGFDDRLDADGDGLPDDCDPCPVDTLLSDGADRDGDGNPDTCDVCPDDALDDSDGDTLCDSDDRCSGFDDRADADDDGIADACDDCDGTCGSDRGPRPGAEGPATPSAGCDCETTRGGGWAWLVGLLAIGRRRRSG